MMRACVFGAGGGIGAALVAALAAREDVTQVYAASRTPPAAGGKIVPLQCDVTDEASIAAVAAAMRGEDGHGPELVMVATGALQFADGSGPERSLRTLDPASMAQLFAINTIAPAIIAKHLLPLFPRDRRAVFAALSARVGSISDNRLGGWYSYRASKAALNMLVKTLAVELVRTHPRAILAALHPGTVDTGLSRPFQRNLPEGQLASAAASAENLLCVLDALEPSESGCFRAWDGQTIPY